MQKTAPIPNNSDSVYNILGVPEPKLKGLDSIQYQLAFWLYGFLHYETCDKTGEKILTIFNNKRLFPFIWIQE